MDYEIKKQKFIELRAEEFSLNKISQELDISKPTLIKWSRELNLEIQNQKSLIIDSLKDELSFTRRKNLENLKAFFSGIEQELLSRDFKDLSSDKLFKLYNETQAQLTKEFEITHKVEESFNLNCLDGMKTTVTWNL